MKMEWKWNENGMKVDESQEHYSPLEKMRRKLFSC
jgi:hypothetical protein